MAKELLKLGDHVKVLPTNGTGTLKSIEDEGYGIVLYDEDYQYLSVDSGFYTARLTDLEKLSVAPEHKGLIIEVYHSRLNRYVQKLACAEYRYIGQNDDGDLIHNHHYYRVLPMDEFRIVNEMDVEQIYPAETFQLIRAIDIDQNIFLTESNRVIHYFNEHRYDIKPLKDVSGIRDLDDLFCLLLKCYCRQTAYPSCQKEYNHQNDPTYGQCAITAMIVNDLFGGTIHKIRVDGGGTHYFNKINDLYFDLTSDQFALYGIPVEYEPNVEIPRQYCGKNPDTAKRYALLKKRLLTLLEEHRDQ